MLLVPGLPGALIAILWVGLLPAVVAATVRSRTGFTVPVDQLSFNPFTANAAPHGLGWKNPDSWPLTRFVGRRDFRADLTLLSLLGNHFEADEIVVEVARLTLVRDQNGTLNAVAFKEALSGREAASSAKVKQGFLIRHLVLKFDKLVYADHRGRQPIVEEYNLNLARDIRDVDSVTKFIRPFTCSVLGLVSNAIGGMFKSNPDLIKELASPLQDARPEDRRKVEGTAGLA